MSDAQEMIEQFRTLALEKFYFLEEKGFRRVARLEETFSTYATVVYLGNHVGFVFSLDIRDQCVDAEVVAVIDGRLKPNLEGGYSSNIFGYLIKHEGYRGKPGGSDEERGQSAIERMLDGWAWLLKNPGAVLLTDQAGLLIPG